MCEGPVTFELKLPGAVSLVHPLEIGKSISNRYALDLGILDPGRA